MFLERRIKPATHAATGAPLERKRLGIPSISLHSLEHFSFTRLHSAVFACEAPAHPVRYCASGVKRIATVNLRFFQSGKCSNKQRHAIFVCSFVETAPRRRHMHAVMAIGHAHAAQLFRGGPDFRLHSLSWRHRAPRHRDRAGTPAIRPLPPTPPLVAVLKTFARALRMTTDKKEQR